MLAMPVATLRLMSWCVHGLRPSFLSSACLPMGPAGEPLFPAKQEVEPIAARDRFDDLRDERCNWQLVLLRVLRALLRKTPGGHVIAELRPLHAADLRAPTSGADEQLDHLTVVIVFQGVPDRGQLLVRQHAIA